MVVDYAIGLNHDRGNKQIVKLSLIIIITTSHFDKRRKPVSRDYASRFCADLNENFD